MVRISVVVPVYNVEKYIDECIVSILEQMSPKDELILVDDGSTDISGILCDRHASIDTRICVVHQENGGVTKARRVGVEAAKGEWILFVDADDTLPSNSIFKLYQISQKYDTELVVGFVYLDNITKREEVVSLEKYRKYTILGGCVPNSSCGRLIKRSLFNNKFILDIPRSITMGEDMLMNIRLSFTLTKNPIILYDVVYNYRKNTKSISHTFKGNLEYEEMFYKLLYKSIPSSDFHKYEVTYIKTRINWLNRLYRYNPMNYDWMNTIVYKQLMNDVKQLNYKMSLIDFIKYQGPIRNDRRIVYLVVLVADFYKKVAILLRKFFC